MKDWGEAHRDRAQVVILTCVYYPELLTVRDEEDNNGCFCF